MRQSTVLVVDDEKEIADFIELYLKNENYNVHKFYNGSWGWGAIYLGLLIIWFVAQIAGSVLINSRSAFAPLGVIFIPFILLHFGIVILSIIEGIMYLTNEQKYNLKYNETSPAPMKW